jgi:alkanesulfonate monooxygenase SsuD/methylene tetrahydromethanopterin reductase-like flavin-dependent oxidoreductase (luciferase family)
MVAIIGGETHRFAPLVELYKNAGLKAGHNPEKLKVGVHSLGYVAETREQAIKDFFPGYAEMFTKIGRERGWPPVTMSHFESQIGPTGALVVGDVKEVAEKVIRHSEALGGLSRFSFQLDVAGLTHEQLMKAIELIGTKVAPIIRKTN